MKYNDTFSFIKEQKICAIVRDTKKEDLFRLADALLQGGVKIIEVTFNTPGAAEMINLLSDKYGKDLAIGAGTCKNILYLYKNLPLVLSILNTAVA